MSTRHIGLSPRNRAKILNFVINDAAAAGVLADESISDDHMTVKLIVEGIELDYYTMIIKECIYHGYGVEFADLAIAGTPFLCTACNKIVTISSSCATNNCWHTTQLLGQISAEQGTQ